MKTPEGEAVEGGEDEFYSEAADVVFVIAGMLAAEGQSLTAWLTKKVDRAEGRVDRVIEKQNAKQRGQD